MLSMNQGASISSCKFLLFRAGATEFDEQGRILGSLDLPLSPSGHLEIQQTAKQLLGLPITAIYSATCQAAQQTANLIAKPLNLKPTVESKFSNLNCGLWHGKSLEELKETQPTLFKQWKEHPEQVCPPGGETVASAIVRVTNVLKKIRRKAKPGIVVIVAPDPLLRIVREELQRSKDRTEKPLVLKCGEWELIDSPAVTV
jgi:phosphoserine phosphatase